MKDRILLALFAINEYLYNYKSQFIILVAWVTALSIFDSLDWWIKAGLVSWICLIIVRAFQKGFNTELQWVKQIIKENGTLPLLVGLNLCIVFGPLAIIFSISLALAMKDKK